MDVTRRNLIQILGIAPAAAAAQTQAEHDHAAPPAPAKKAYQRKVFDDHQWRTVQVLCDLIIPADEHSGSATAAGVPEFIDDWLDFRTHEDGNENFAARSAGRTGLAGPGIDAPVSEGFRRAPRRRSRSRFWTASPGPTGPPRRTGAGRLSSPASAI